MLIAARDSPTVKVGIADRLDQRHGFGGQPRRLAHPAVTHVLHHQPGHADGQRRLVPGGRAQLSQLLKAGRRRCRHGPGRRCRTARRAAAMRIAVRSASSAGSASATWRARSQLARAAAMSRVVAHAPARMCQP